MLPPVAGFVKLSLCDWPGHVAATVFLQGCNFRCPWCHNPELVYPKLFSTPLSDSEVERFISSLSPKMYDGVVVSGGEPTVHPSLPNLLLLIKQKGLKVRLDTNGSNPELLEYLMNESLIDEVAMDYKLPLDMYHLVGCDDPDAVRKSMSILAKRRNGYLRTTVVSGLHTEEVLSRMKEELQSIAGGRLKWILQEYRESPLVSTQSTTPD
ncbi:MAG TPA: anaerobic ribonucleoside-triphosphate reductase activating protein [Caldanaerobacter subterraneus]|uniref:Anaerobic ribonucleoside-triphosphate reductase activating protein n=1 Tax=Caldanaerobacter subterraneus TaxID=911092 RepID=A0A357VPP1_9THEO|nr:anaerobic ribonucleoside-triphosphate reductase activating protein [Caldanaerobacter subterraneus]HBT49877.1 anaerobic ribonucleoside-triphosphate reductase activating protein [Caldanaerobacter subterraneus]